ncbi:Gfo/Idh/MocA family protein [Mucilaginibacter myungsuensis]|uniref:Gfo/Idh/MocA family oxidoreductase n=1 Tax=Mucilaginibacter myungsuensis TaxID=649104 RepID=A0A929KVV6_9SPHI|nr:Gfo/Idh/MocA family oxidoreductase [Mucilaginibacter myungsuensis]MBE9662559.1 Gfo/Idh/MocA family oxidoreductase [Mucilaginibacter myungsuensis]MDN3597979.1 Gfo/Idh/MocA family oxidoreductase [Mucilaginibacter myungsuensis]
MEKRREFLKKLAVASAGVAASNSLMGMSAKSYRNIIGANERINVALIGLNGRGTSMAGTFVKQADCKVATLCDVDTRVYAKALKAVANAKQADVPTTESDCRKVLQNKDIDAIYIATPDHWHAPLTIMGCQAGKHVYVEKPLSHNPHEGELAVAAAKKYKKVVQMGAQRRSAPVLTQGIKELHDGIIGRVYLAKTWYTNKRGPNVLKPGTVPAELNYDLWQGPAPRMDYKDGLIHYNWHWFWNWGTGEALNNGTHEVDVARWGLGVDYPTKVASIGGRYNYKDDWETPDTQIITMDFPGRVSLMWEGRSANGRKTEELDRGIIFYGDKGSLDTGGDSYKVYDLDGKLIKDVKSLIKEDTVDARNTASVSLGMDSLHVANFLDSIRNNKEANCSAEIGHKSILGMQLGNIAWRVGRDLKVDPKNGHIINDPEAQKLWKRSYAPGWEPKV